MTINCCKTHEIHRFNDEKEYTLMATALLDAVITDDALSPAAAKLWQFLYNRARFDNQLQVKVEQRYLASCFKKSLRTITRYINELESFGYLVSEANYSRCGSRLANTYHLQLPSSVRDTLAQKPNRQKPQATMESNALTPPDKTVTPPPDIFVGSNNNIKYNNTNNITVVEFSSEKDKVSLTEQSPPSIAENVATSQVENTKPSETMFHVEQLPETKHDESAHWEDESPIEVNAAVHSTKQDKLERNIQKAEASITELKTQLLHSDEPEHQAQLLQALTEHEAHRDRFQMDLEYLMRQIQDEQQTNQQAQQLNANPVFVHEIEGKRSFSAFEMNRLKKGLIRNCPASDLPRLLNEVTYSIRFGDLELRQGSDKPLEIQHAISIALKLVREGRWQTPVGLSSFVHNTLAVSK